MSTPEPGSYGQSVYAQGGLVSPSGSVPPPAFQRALPSRNAADLRRHPARTAEVTWLTVAEVAAELRVSKMTVYRAIHGGELAAIRVRRSFRVADTALADTALADFAVSDTAARPHRTDPSQETSCPSTPNQ